MSCIAAFFEAFDEEERILREILPKEHKYYFTWKTIQESNVEHPPAPIVSVRTQSILPCKWANEIKALITRSTGYDHVIDYRTITGKEINAAYLPDYAGRAVAEQALLLWASLLRKLELQTRSFDTFERNNITGRELKSRRITVLGVGRIGSQIVDIALGLRMRVKGVDVVPHEICGLEYVDLKEGVEQAEILVCALPLTAETCGLLDYHLLRQMPAGSIFVNIARGEISPTKDILRLLKEGVLSGVGLDVYEYEKELAAVLRDGSALKDIDDSVARASVEAAMELRSRDDVIFTPHNAFNTSESVERKSRLTAENLLSYLETGTFVTPVPLNSYGSRLIKRS
jgi:D-lactate dehydrogenase